MNSLLLVASCGALLLSSLLATEEHLIRVALPLATSPEVDISRIPFMTSFGAIEESTLHAMTWPCRIPGRDEDGKVQLSDELNLVCRLGVDIRLERKESTWNLFLDLTKFRSLPKDFAEERLSEDMDRKAILGKIVEAMERNLRSVAVLDCPLTVLGQDQHDDLRDFHAPATLNTTESAWGKWSYTHLPRQWSDGDLPALAAQAAVDPEEAAAALPSIFLISTEDLPAAATEEMGDFLRKLLARVGDDAYSTALKAAEASVRTKVLNLLSQGPDLSAQFPRTLGLKPKAPASEAKEDS